MARAGLMKRRLKHFQIRESPVPPHHILRGQTPYLSRPAPQLHPELRLPQPILFNLCKSAPSVDKLPALKSLDRRGMSPQMAQICTD